MPRYAFQCRSCGATFEEKRPFSQSSAPAACPDCLSTDTAKLLHAINVVGLQRAGDSIPLPMNNGGGGGCGCGGGGCGCH